MSSPQVAIQSSPGQFRVAVIGPGLIGSFLAAILSSDPKLAVLLFGREQTGLDVAAYGLHASWQDGEQHLSAQGGAVAYFSHFQALIEADIVLLAVKATALLPLLHQIKGFLRAEVPVIALQNGIGILDILHSQLKNPLFRALVPFNVVRTKAGHFQQSSAGELIWPQTPHPLLKLVAQSFRSTGLPVVEEPDMQAAEYGKLLLNLNNALNALSGLPLKSQLMQRPWRRLMAAAMAEWLQICQQQGFTLRQYTAVSPRWLPVLLRSPDWLFTRLAARMLRIDPQARLSMAFDLERGVRTEIQFLNGAVNALGQRYQLATPVNQAITDFILAAEAGHSPVIDPVLWCEQLGLNR